MVKFAQSQCRQPKPQRRLLLWLTVFSLLGFLSLTYLAFHLPPSLVDKNNIKQNNEIRTVTRNPSQAMPSHPHDDEQQGKSQADNQLSKNQNSRMVDALLVMGGLGCH